MKKNFKINKEMKEGKNNMVTNQNKNLFTVESLEKRFSNKLKTEVLNFNSCLLSLEKIYVLKEQKESFSHATYYRLLDEFWNELNFNIKFLNVDYYDSFSNSENLQAIYCQLLHWQRNFELFKDSKVDCKVYISRHKSLLKKLLYFISFFDNKKSNNDIDYKALSNNLIDRMIDINGLGEAINFLAFIGFTKQDMVETFKFNKSDVDNYYKNNDVLTSLKDLLREPSVKWLGRIHLVNVNDYEKKHWASSPTYMSKEQAIKEYGDNLSWYEEEEEDDNVHRIINVLTDEILDEFGHRKEVK